MPAIKYRPKTHQSSPVPIKSVHPKFIFAGLKNGGVTGMKAQGIRVVEDVRPDSFVTALIYEQYGESMLVVPARDSDVKMSSVLGRRRPSQLADRITWSNPKFPVVIYVPLKSDIEEYGKRYFLPSVVQVLVKAYPNPLVKKNALDDLISDGEIIESFVDNTLKLYERACIANLVSIDDVEKDFGKMQKLLTMVTRGATPGERGAALNAVRILMEKLKERCSNA